jgi:hypothetical protein
LSAADPATRLLETIPGVGPRTAEAVAAHLGDPARFATGEPVGAHAGLAPRQYQSGATDRRGPGVLRKLLVECAWCMRRYNPWARAVYARLTAGGPSRKKPAIAALARKLLVRCWAVLRAGGSRGGPTRSRSPGSGPGAGRTRGPVRVSSELGLPARDTPVPPEGGRTNGRRGGSDGWGRAPRPATPDSRVRSRVARPAGEAAGTRPGGRAGVALPPPGRRAKEGGRRKGKNEELLPGRPAAPLSTRLSSTGPLGELCISESLHAGRVGCSAGIHLMASLATGRTCRQ